MCYFNLDLLNNFSIYMNKYYEMNHLNYIKSSNNSENTNLGYFVESLMLFALVENHNIALSFIVNIDLILESNQRTSLIHVYF